MLENILQQGLRVARENLGAEEAEIYAYLHYQPSYYHLHVHFTNKTTNHSALRNHELQQVIANLRLQSDYYQTNVMSYSLQKNGPLHRFLNQKGEK